MPAYHIHIQGQVQGVGFRPFIYKKAIYNKFTGWVNNTNTGVQIEIEGNEELIREFYAEIINNPPELSIITESSINQIPHLNLNNFNIIYSRNSEQPNLLLTPDFGICNACKNELLDKKNRRYNYPFITCTNCGPRYSIIKKLPYDRNNTAMDSFMMCDNCKAEFENPLNRRHYSQTNSCCECAVELSVLGAKRKREQIEILNLIENSLQKGEIVAVKGIGGYLILADATNSNTIKTLRERKHRPFKPFALMYPSDKSLLEDVNATEKELELFFSIKAPIVLFNLKREIKSGLKKNLIAHNLNQIGVMKPYTPLFVLIVESLNFPIVATSANVSDSPIVYEDEKAQQELSDIADLIVGNNRDIVIPQDDSVVKFSQEFQQKIIIRRSRGLSPTFISPVENINTDECLLGMGAGLKGSFTLYHQKNTYISQYLGNLESSDSQESYESVLKHYLNLLQAKPGIIVVDKHPQYFSTQYGNELAENLGADIYEVQHHKAHFSGVLAENGLIDTQENVLGVIWDGIGIGDDKQIWGGEFFSYCNKQMKRIAHFEYYQHIGFDKFAKEPRLAALAVTNEIKYANELLEGRFTPTEFKNYLKLIKKAGGLKTSSLGRLFDALAFLLGFINANTFEGEGAMILESKALDFYNENKNYFYFYNMKFTKNTISVKHLFCQIINDLRLKISKEEIALKFHLTLVDAIKTTAERYSTKKIAFSGGVFQNSLLVDLIHRSLGGKFSLYFHQQLSPNDENISYGQLVYVNNKIK